MKTRLKQGLVLLGLFGALVVMRVYGSAPARELEAWAVSPRVLQPLVLASGQLAFAREASLSSELVGRVTRILVQEGEHVQAGQTLLQLDPNSYAAHVAQQEAQTRESRLNIQRASLNVANLEREFSRKQQLAAAQFLGPSALEDARHVLESARVDLQASQESLRQSEAALVVARESMGKTEIKAPISGTVVALPIRVGETAVPSSSGIPGSALMTVADTRAMHAEVLVDEAEVASVSVGQSARIYPAGRDDFELQGKVSSVALMPKAGSRNYLVRVALSSPGSQLRTGMSCRVELLGVGRPPALAVPVQAVLTGSALKGADERAKAPVGAAENGAQVWVWRDGRAQRQTVSLGLSDDRYQEVRSGLKAGDQILVGPIRALRELAEGESVRTTAWKDGGAS